MSDAAEPATSPDAISTARRAVALGVFAVSTVASAAFAYVFLFSQFMDWDDEGYFLLALRAYREGHGLYERIQTIYGPFYFQVVSVLFSLLRLPLDNSGARWFVLGVWIVSCWCVYDYVRRATLSALAGLVAYASAFPILTALGNEPLHPGGLIVVLLSALILVSRGLETPRLRSASLVACGALCAAIALTKLNAGLFTLIAFAAFFSAHAPSTRAGKARRILVAVLLPMLPFCLMAPLLGQKGIRGFACLVALALVPFGFLSPPRPHRLTLRDALPYLLGGLALTSVVLLLCFLTGTRPSGLWRSLVLDTLKFAGAFVFPARRTWSLGLLASLATPACVGALLRWTTVLRQGWQMPIKLTGGLILLGLCQFPPLIPMLGLPLVWLVAVPGPSSKRGSGTRMLLGLLVVLQSMHAYPVAGSQLGFFSFLLPVVGAVIICDALGELPMPWREEFGRARWRFIGAATVLLIVATCNFAVAISPTIWTRFEEAVPLGLRGTEGIRLPELRVAQLQWVASNLEQNADTFVGLPGVHSFYGWTGLRPPVRFYPHTWILLSDDTEQAKLVEALTAFRRPCILRNRSLVQFWLGHLWTKRRLVRPGPLVGATNQEFRVAGAVGDYELLLPPSAHPDLVLSALPVRPPQALLDRYRAESAYRLAFPAMPGVRVARIVARDMGADANVVDSAEDSFARRLTILDTSGAPMLQGNPPVPIDLSQRLDVLMLCPPTTAAVTPERGLVRAYDEQGRIVARLLLPSGVQAQ